MPWADVGTPPWDYKTRENQESHQGQVFNSSGVLCRDGDANSDLIASIDSLRKQVEVLRNAVDDLREELQYLVRNPGENRVAETIERLRVTSLPLDPAADDFGQRVNAVPKETVAELRTAAETAQENKQRPATSQRGLF